MIPSFESRLLALSTALAEGEWLWRPRPFATSSPPWAERAPDLAVFCEGLEDAQLYALEEGAPLPASAPPLLHGWVARLNDLTTIFPPPARSHDTCDDPWMIPSRKFAQVTRFGEALTDTTPTVTHVLDWCGGKGHLGRLLGKRLGVEVTVLEREATYESEARTLAARAGVGLRFAACDAMSDEARALSKALPATTLAVGLHACGVLGERLLTLAKDHTFGQVAHSPCCLHKVPGLKDGAWSPMATVTRSALATSGLRLDHSALRLATSDEVVARPALRAQRTRENAYRLALDLLLQEQSGKPGYTPLGTLPAHLVRADFATFAQGASEMLGLTLPPFDAEAALTAGFARARSARRYGLVRSLFRRAIELVVVFDRAAYLEEHGYEVEVFEFAPREVTPRNLLIRACHHPRPEPGPARP